MANQIQVYQGLAYGELTVQDITTVRATIAKDCNEEQFKLFMSIAKASGANPIMNEIYPTVRQGQLTVQFGIDFFVRKAKESDGYQGYDVQLVHENDEFQMHQEKDEDGRYYVVIDKHSWGFPRGRVVGGYAIAYREGYKPFTVVMEVEEVEHFKRSNIGMQKTMWTNYFNDMFKKHMVRRALKAAFELNFEDEEVVNGGDGIPEYQTQRKDVTPQPDVIDAPETNEDGEGTKIKKIRAEISAKFKTLGISKEEQKAYMEQHVPNFQGTLSDYVGLSELLDMHIDMSMQDMSDDELPFSDEDSLE
jgi:recombination protein RecT